MRVALYARVSTTRQAQAQGIEQQLDRLRAAAAERGWELDDQHVYRDDGYSGARIGRPGLDRLRDHAALAELDLVLVTAPDRLARNYVHQVLLIEELAGHGCQVEFLDRPMSADPHDQLLLQIRGAVAEYERTLIAERMRRGRQAKLRAGTLLPWTTAPFGYRLDPERPRRADAVRTDPGEAALIAQLFDWYLEPGATIYQLAARLTDLGVPAPMGGPRWNVASVRGILRNPAYAGRALSNRTQVAPARRRKSAMLPAGPGQSHAPRPEEDWIAVPVPPIVSEEIFAQVQAKLDANQQCAARNTRHEYLLRALVSCGACRLSCTGRQVAKGYRYYLCRGRTDPLRAAQGQRCTARYIPAAQLDELVWADLCALLTDPAQAARALARAQGGAWLPQELQARQATIGQALAQLDRQQQRLLDAYLAEVIALAELDRKRQDLDRRRDTLLAQQRQLDAAARQKLELGAVADGIEAFCQTVRAGLAAATFEQRRQLAELLIDCVVVTDGDVEIRYVLPTSPDGPHRPFCQLRKDHLAGPPHAVQLGDVAGRVGTGVHQAGDDGDGLGHFHPHRAGRPAAQPAVVLALVPAVQDADGRAGRRAGEQRVAGREIEDLVHVVFHDADLDGAAAPGDLRFPGPVRQRPSRAAQVPRRRHPPGEVLPGGDLGGGRFAAGEPAVGQVQVPGAVGGFEVPGEGGLPDAAGPGRPCHAGPEPHVGDLYHPDLRGRVRAGAGRAAEVRGVAGLPAGPLPVGALRVGDHADGAVLGQYPQPVPAALPPRAARAPGRAQPDRERVPGRRPRRGKARRRHARQRCRADLPAQPGQQPQERPDLQEAVRVRQRRRRRQVIARVGLPVPLR